MTTNKTKREKKRLKKHLKKDKTKKKHRHHRRKSVSSWKNHYTYESDNLNPTSISNGSNNKNSLNNGIIVNGLRDFLALKKDKK
jgi:hypothetical protein